MHYYLLCEAKLERVLHVKEGSSIDDCSLEQYDSIISYPRNASNDHMQHYLSWKGKDYLILTELYCDNIIYNNFSTF